MKKRGNTSAAVMEQRAPAEVEADDPLSKLYRALDFYPTPPWGARAVVDLIERLDPAMVACKGRIWEPACGEGHMAGPLRDLGFPVTATDIHPFGFGDVCDFLDPGQCLALPAVDWVITNPPFSHAAEFVRRGMQRARRGVAVLCRIAFIESDGRYDLFTGRRPLTLFAPFAERLPMQLGSWDPALRTATAYAWFLWRHGADPLPPFIIPPGTRARLWHADDAERWGVKAPAPLLDLMEFGVAPC